MLAINDDVFSRMTDRAFEGEILLGVPSDIIHPIVPVALMRFHAEFSGIKVQLISSYTRVLKDKLKNVIKDQKINSINSNILFFFKSDYFKQTYPLLFQKKICLISAA